MNKIIQIAPNITVKGGISTVLRMYLTTDLPQRYNIQFLVTHEDGTKLHKLLVMVAGIINFFFMLLTNNFDIAHIHCGDIPSPYRKYFFFKLSKLFRLKTILHWHGGNFFTEYAKVSKFQKKIFKAFFESADIVICLSQLWYDSLGQLFPKSNRILIFNSIFLPTVNQINLKKTVNPIKILFLGQIKKKKGIYDLLTVFERLVKEGYDIQLTIGGNGEEDKLKSIISTPLIKDRVEYLGWIDENQKNHQLSSNDLFVLPSYGEAMPMSILEAMAYGLAVVSTSVGGIPELVEEGTTGYLVEPGNLDELFDRLKILIEKPKLRVDMGLYARQRVEKQFDIRKNYLTLCHIYDQLQSKT